jgi:ankyrin repeat protein
MTRVVALAMTLTALACAPRLALAQATDDRVREAATRGFALIQATQKVSLTRQGCGATCHLQHAGAFAYVAMKERGLPVDEEVARADAMKAYAGRASNVRNAIEQRATSEVGPDAFGLVAAHTMGLPRTFAMAAYARAVALQQRPAGDWTGVAVRVPSSASSFAFTAWGLRALQLYGHPSQKEDVAGRVARARNWLETHQPKSTEDRTFQLLGGWWAGADRAARASMGRALAATQQADGGWNSLVGRSSDAYSTGQALVALHDAAGMPTSDPAWRRGLAFLLANQAADGSWHVESRLPSVLAVSPPYYESGYPYGHDQFISVHGANWAVTALARALGPAQTVGSLPLSSVTATDIDPWVETAVFGSVSDLKRLLDGGLDANASTTGGLSVLMVVQPDVEKTRLLLDRGANLNGRSRDASSALMVAAQYRGGTAAIRLLLERGAEIGLPAGQQTNRGGSAFFYAAHEGNAEVLPLLRPQGAAINDRARLFGSLPATPLSASVFLGEPEATKALIALGANVEDGDENGYTPLMQAVLGNRIEHVTLLIAAGADVNRPDRRGMTPLQIAASIDHGDAIVIELLLKAGARVEAQDKDGLTALQLAEKFRHTHLVPSLRAASNRARR